MAQKKVEFDNIIHDMKNGSRGFWLHSPDLIEQLPSEDNVSTFWLIWVRSDWCFFSPVTSLKKKHLHNKNTQKVINSCLKHLRNGSWEWRPHMIFIWVWKADCFLPLFLDVLLLQKGNDVFWTTNVNVLHVTLSSLISLHAHPER